MNERFNTIGQIKRKTVSFLIKIWGLGQVIDLLWKLLMNVAESQKY